MKIKHKHSISLGLLSICTALFLFYIFFNISNQDITGYQILDTKTNISTMIENATLTEQEAVEKIESIKEIINEMEKNNFSIAYVTDVLINAERIFEQARNAEILRNQSKFSQTDVTKAKEALRLVDWKNIHFEDILIYSEEAKERREQSLLIYDSLLAAELKITASEEKGVEFTESKELLEEAKTSFNEDRYEESLLLIEELTTKIEEEKQEHSRWRVLTKTFIGVLIKNWYWVLLVLIIISGSSYYGYKKIRHEKLKEKIKKLKAEKIGLIELIKKAQTERFKENKITELTYKTQMKKYEYRMNKIEQILPVLEEKLGLEVKQIEDKKTVKQGLTIHLTL